MMADYEYRTRPGRLWLTMLAFAGLVLLSAFLWRLAPGFVLLLMTPALLVCGYQIVVSPIYGLVLSQDRWKILSEGPDYEIAPADIAHIQLSDRPERPRVTIVLKDGKAVPLPDLAVPADPITLIRQATERGIPVRQF